LIVMQQLCLLPSPACLMYTYRRHWLLCAVPVLQTTKPIGLWHPQPPCLLQLHKRHLLVHTTSHHIRPSPANQHLICILIEFIIRHSFPKLAQDPPPP
jgi:hypothetical protein